LFTGAATAAGSVPTQRVLGVFKKQIFIHLCSFNVKKKLLEMIAWVSLLNKISGQKEQVIKTFGGFANPNLKRTIYKMFCPRQLLS